MSTARTSSTSTVVVLVSALPRPTGAACKCQAARIMPAAEHKASPSGAAAGHCLQSLCCHANPAVGSRRSAVHRLGGHDLDTEAAQPDIGELLGGYEPDRGNPEIF